MPLALLRSAIVTSLLALLLTAGCDMMIYPWQRSDLKAMANQTVTCTAGTDCDAKWHRAKLWLTRHSEYPLQVTTATQLKTVKAPPGNPAVSFTLSKVALENDTYRIDFEAFCNNVVGCAPPILKLKANFVEFMKRPEPLIPEANAPEPEPETTAPEVN